MVAKLKSASINQWKRCTDHTKEHIEAVYGDGLTAAEISRRDIKPFYKVWLLVRFLKQVNGIERLAEYQAWCKDNARGRSIYLCNACIPITRCGSRLHGTFEITEDMVKSDAEMWDERIAKLVDMIGDE